jgi:hypothetical protein
MTNTAVRMEIIAIIKRLLAELWRMRSLGEEPGFYGPAFWPSSPDTAKGRYEAHLAAEIVEFEQILLGLK